MNGNQARYIDIAEHLRKLVADSSPGDLLPSDSDLCEQFDVSRMTARQAVQLLVNEHLVDRRRGKGTFVAPRRVSRALGSPLSFSEDMRRRGRIATSSVIDSWLAMATEEDAEALGLEVGDAVRVIERVRLADDVPMAMERAVVVEEVAAELEEDLEAGSLHAAFEASGRIPSRALATVGARLSTTGEQEYLELEESGVVMIEERTIYDQEGEPLERTTTVYAADRYTFSTMLYPYTEDSDE